MKKTINSIAVAFLLLGCSSDSNYEIPLTSFNASDERIKGMWYIDKVIQADGSITDYIHLCPTERDKVDFTYNLIQEFYHSSNCEVIYNYQCSNYQTVGFSINGASCNDIFTGTYSYTNINNNPTLRLDYDGEEYFGSTLNNFVSAKGLIFSRD